MEVRVHPIKTRQGFMTYKPICENAKMILELTRNSNITQAMIEVLKRHNVKVTMVDK